MKPRRPTLTDKLRVARAALKAIRIMSTATTPQQRLEYVRAMAETALEMSK